MVNRARLSWKMNEKIGIYGIRNTLTSYIYIGKSVSVNKRITVHKNNLASKRHFNQHLQSSYNKHGEQSFEFLVLENCEQSDLATKEQCWIDFYSCTGVYNKILDVKNYNFTEHIRNKISRSNSTLFGERNGFYGKHHTSETRRKLSLQRKGKNLGEENPNYGNKQPLNVRLEMALNNCHTKLTTENVLIITELLRQGLNHDEIAKQFNISRSVITRTSNGTRWTNITGGAIFPVEYQNGVRRFTDQHRQKIGRGRLGKKHSAESKIKISKARLALLDKKRRTSCL